MKNRSRWILWGILVSAGILAAALIVALWVLEPSNLPDDAVFVPRDVSSLQGALDEAAPGTTIVIQASAGSIQGPIRITVPDITLVSSGSKASLNSSGSDPALSIRAAGVIVRGFDINSESIGLQINASDCTIEDLRVESKSIAIQLNNASRCVLQSIETSGGRIGVELINSGSVVAEDLTIVDAAEIGMRLLGSRNNSLRNLNLSGNAVGISIEGGSTDNVIEGCDIELSSVAGIEIRGSNDNLLIGNGFDSVRVGILLDRVTGTEIRDCQIQSPEVAGVLLKQAIQNRIVSTWIEGSHGAGIQLAQSAENALLYNEVSDCGEGGIHLTSSGKNLIMGNELDGCSIGIQLTRSNDNRILRNRASNSDEVGFFVSLGRSNRLLDNVSIDGSYGIMLSESGDNIVLRNTIAGADRIGLSLAQTLGRNHLSENEVEACSWGLLLASSTRDLITYNRFTNNEVGVVLVQLGSGIRIEGNTITGNDIGLQHRADLAGLEDDLERLGIPLLQSAESALPILTNNVFMENYDFDIQNQSAIHLLAAGNWWGTASVRDPRDAVVSDGVSLEQSAWKGTIAVGTGSDEVRILLGRILQLTLAGEGFRVIDLVGMGPSERVQQALLDADADLIWWSGSEFEAQVPIEGSLSVVLPTSAYEGWRIVVSAQLAGQLAEPTASGLAIWFNDAGERLRYTAISTLGDESFKSFLAAYKLEGSVRSLTQANALEEAEALLKFGAVDVAIVGSLKETLTLSGFLAIEDDLRVLERNSISMVVQQSIVAKYPDTQDILKALGERLTSEVVHNLVSRIRMLRMDPEDVAREFLQQ